MNEIQQLNNGRETGGTESVIEQQLVTFFIDRELYGVAVLKVQEIIGMTQIIHVPNSLPYMKGVINLRGSVVPVVDMRTKFEIESRDYDSFTVILIVEVSGILIGMIVDSVSDVVDVSVGSIQQTPHFSSNIDRDYISGIARHGEELIIMLDVDRILCPEDLNEIDKSMPRQAREGL